MKIKKEIYNNLVRLNSLILYILPISLVTGPFIPNLIVTLVCFISLFLIIYNKQLKYFDNLFFKFFSIFSIYLIINSLLNLNFISGISGFTYLRYGIFSIAIWHTLENNSNFFRNFTKIFFLTFLLIFIDSIFQYFYGTNLLGMQKSTYNKLSSFFGRDVKLGAYLARGYFFIFLFFYLFLNRKLSNTIYFNLFNVLFVIIILLTGERTSFFIFILNFLLINLFVKSKFFYKIICFLIVLVTTVVIFTTIKDVKIRYVDTTIKQLNESRSNTVGYNIFSSAHESHYKIAYKMFMDNKFFGQGPNSFRNLCGLDKFRISEIEGEGCTTHPHNIYIQLLGETGLIGFLFLLISFFYIYYVIINYLIKILKNNTNFKNKIYFYVPIAVYLFPFIPTGSFFNSWVNIIVYLPMGFLLKEIYSKK
jgi:O-antigen ligase